jgi:hypothetical protein
MKLQKKPAGARAFSPSPHFQKRPWERGWRPLSFTKLLEEALSSAEAYMKFLVREK